MKKKTCLYLTFLTMLAVASAGCGGTDSESKEPAAIEEAASVDSDDAASNDEKRASDAATGVLPAYEYKGDAQIAAICDYLTKEIASSYSEADVSIPYMQIIDTDNSDPEDTLVWGDYWIMNYNLDGDVLAADSGGNYPGLMHLQKNSDENYVVTEFEQVADGTDFAQSAKELFGDRYETFIEVQSDDETFEEIRKEYIKEYVASNGLNITAYQDYGWDPVSLE